MSQSQRRRYPSIVSLLHSLFRASLLASTDSCVDPLSLAELQTFDPSRSILDHNLALTYGASRGIHGLRAQIASLYDAKGLDVEDILVTSGTISANFIVLDTLVSAGDHIIVQHPTYLQLLEIPKRAGAEVSLWKWQESTDGLSWKMDLQELESMFRPNTKALVLSTPNNPLGSTLSRGDLEHIVKLAARKGIFIVCDEVFRFMHHDETVQPTPSLLELGYDRAIVTGSISKGFALPGVRVGWVAASPELRRTTLNDIAHTRDYTTIAVSQVDQQIAAFALSPNVRPKILARSNALCENNLKVLRSWTQRNRAWASFKEPSGGGTLVMKILGRDGPPVDDVAFAEALAKTHGVSVPPAGLCFGEEADGTGSTDLKGHLRIGFVQKEGPMEVGLDAIAHLREVWT